LGSEAHTGGRPPKRPAIKPPLNVKKIQKAKAWVTVSGTRWRLQDSDRLLLDLNPSRRRGATASWTWRKLSRDHGLGPWPAVSVQRARELAFEHERRFRETGSQPIDLRRQARSAAAVAKATQLTFGEAAAQYFRQVSPSWRNVKSAASWHARVLGKTLSGVPSDADWCGRLRPVLLADVTTPLIIAQLEERWSTQPVTGARVAQSINSVFAWALARQLLCQPMNPADWAVISKALPGKLRDTQHFSAMAYKDVPRFMAELHQRPGVAARLLELTILTAARTAETRLAVWSEFSDLDGPAPLWVIPPHRMKGGREHRVPLSHGSVTVLKALPREEDSPFVFVGAQPGKPLAQDSMLRVLHAMEQGGVTAHGFRSAFSDWAHEKTTFEPLIVEAALAHAAGSKVEKAYRRGDLLAKRRSLMDGWASFVLGGESATVVPLHGVVR
jgi:integrase